MAELTQEQILELFHQIDLRFDHIELTLDEARKEALAIQDVLFVIQQDFRNIRTRITHADNRLARIEDAICNGSH